MTKQASPWSVVLGICAFMSISIQIIARTIAVCRSTPGNQEQFLLPPCAALLAGSLKSACSLTGDRLLATNRSRRWRCGLGRKESTYGPAMPLRCKINVDIAGSCFQTRADNVVVAGRLSQALGWRGRRGAHTSPASIGLRSSS